MVVDFFSQLGNLVHLFRFYFLLFHHTIEVFSQGWWSKAHVSHEERCILLSGTHSPEKVFIKSDLILRVTESFLILAMKCIHCRLCWLLLSYLHSGALPNGFLLSYVVFEAPGATVSLAGFVHRLPQWNSCSGIQCSSTAITTDFAGTNCFVFSMIKLHMM